MVNSLNDGLGKPDQLADSAVQAIEIGSGDVTTVNISGLAVTTAKLAAASVTAAKQNFMGAGSPVVVGNHSQTGSGVTGAGSDAWHIFPTAFAAAPFVVVGQAETLEAIHAPAGSWNAGSFYVQTTSASQTFAFHATGSGNL